MQSDVVIIGGGLAGLSCGLALSSRGLHVELLEASDSLGGRARSWIHAPTGDAVDIGPHIFLSHYPNMLALLEQLGTRDRICWQTDRLITLLTNGHADVMRVHRLPAPLHLMPSLARARAVKLRDKLSNARASWAAMKVDESRVAELDHMSASDFVRQMSVSEDFRKWFWNSACMALMNVPLERCSAGALLRVYAQLMGHNAYAIGFANCGLSELYTEQARERIEQHDGHVRLHRPVSRVSISRDGFNVDVSGHDTIIARHVVAAIPPQQLGSLIASIPALTDLQSRARMFRPSPYVSVYLWLDRKITTLKFWSGVWSPSRFNYDFYDLSNIRRGWSERPSVIASNVIYNERAQDMPDDEIITVTLNEIAEFAPDVRSARVLQADVHRIEMAIPAPMVGTENARPAANTSVPGFVVAGDWTHTSLPSSMESAVRSGWLAAEAVLQRVGRPASIAKSPPQTTGLPGWVRRRANHRRRTTKVTSAVDAIPARRSP